MGIRDRLRHCRDLLRARPWAPGHARALWRTRRPEPSQDVDVDRALDSAVAWLFRAQDATPGGGVSDYALTTGWSAPYPETTGYIIPTLLRHADRRDCPEAAKRALRMADWLCDLQEQGGYWQGGHLDNLTGPSVFNTGQIIQGLLAAWRVSAEEPYRGAAVRGAEWLASVQDADGLWSRYTFDGGPVAYHARISYPLAEVGVAFGREDLVEAAGRHLDWVCTLQRDDGWIDRMSFKFVPHAFTHTVAYTLEGLLKAGLLLEQDRWVGAAEQAARALRADLESRGRLAGSYAEGWEGQFDFVCLTGDAQMAEVWCLLAGATGDRAYAAAGRQLVAALAARQDRRNPSPALRGALAGSAPVWGRYTPWGYPNWAAKFFVDAVEAVKEATECSAS